MHRSNPLEHDLQRLETLIDMRPNAHYTAALNLERVRGYMESHLGCSGKDIARALDMSIDQAMRAMRKIRSEWGR